MPRPAQADIRCSTVWTLAPLDDTVDASRVSVTASAVIAISTGSGRSTRRNTMPASMGAGLSVSSTRCPLCSPTPTARVMDLRVRCWSTAAILGGRGARRAVRLAMSVIAAIWDGQSAWRRRKAGISKSSIPPEDSASTLAAAMVRLVRHTLGTAMPS